MNYVQPQNANAPMPQQVNQPQQGYALMPQPQQVNQPQVQQPSVQQSQGTEFYGATIDPQTMAVVQQCYGASNTALNTTLNDNSTVAKSLYFGARDMFKTLYVNQIILIFKSNERLNKIIKRKNNRECLGYLK